MPSLDRELKIVCLDENTSIASRLASQYQNTRIYVGAPEQIIISRHAADGVTIAGLHRLAEPMTSTQELNPDVVLLVFHTKPHSHALHVTNERLRAYRKLFQYEPELPILAVMPPSMKIDTDSGDFNSIQEILMRQMSESMFSDEDIDEVYFRIRRLLALKESRQTLTESKQRHLRLPDAPIQIRTISGIVSSFVPELRGQTGRLDARKVSRMFGITMTDLARLLGKEKSAVSKTPDAVSLQPGLQTFERIASMLRYITMDEDQLRMWMNAPNKEFRGKPPMDFLRDGLGEIVAQRLENALAGQPA